GNVLATVSDKKVGIDTDSDGIYDYFQAEVVSASDYYPFGMLMPGRQVGMGINIPGGEVSGTTEVNGYQLPVDLVLSSRSGIEPSEYVASNSIELSGEFESGATDEFDAYIADESYAGTGNQYTGGGMYGTAGVYRYGFNGKENDNEVKGTGNQQDYGMRIHDPRLGRFLSVDPLFKSYTMLTPYQYSSNSPIGSIDLDGEESKVVVHIFGTSQSKPILTIEKEDNNIPIQDGFHYEVHQYKTFNNGKVLNTSTYNYIVDDNTGKKVFLFGGLASAEKAHSSPFGFRLSKTSISTISAPWMTIAEKEIGQVEIKEKNKHNERIIEYHSTTSGKFQDDETAWCSSFVNWTMEKAGYSGTGSARALSWKDWGKSTGGEPVFGAIAVIDYGGGKGHVGFVTAIDGDNITILLGGNQGDQVKESKFKRKDIIDYRVPSKYTIPSSDRQLKKKSIKGNKETQKSTR
ncbi:TIGR02594 family protein, partial [Flavihumibacter sp. CACIAM 22H1]|uniref:TIGR02594 family protein n=1 Tax=Flavihumibacter sp. CACIAM 22H1 TaxID=1812911 RepID=UPI0025BE9BB0